jgi:hypothetical protein
MQTEHIAGLNNDAVSLDHPHQAIISHQLVRIPEMRMKIDHDRATLNTMHSHTFNAESKRMPLLQSLADNPRAHGGDDLARATSSSRFQAPQRFVAARSLSLFLVRAENLRKPLAAASNLRWLRGNDPQAQDAWRSRVRIQVKCRQP